MKNTLFFALQVVAATAGLVLLLSFIIGSPDIGALLAGAAVVAWLLTIQLADRHADKPSGRRLLSRCLAVLLVTVLALRVGLHVASSGGSEISTGNVAGVIGRAFGDWAILGIALTLASLRLMSRAPRPWLPVSVVAGAGVGLMAVLWTAGHRPESQPLRQVRLDSLALLLEADLMWTASRFYPYARDCPERMATLRQRAETYNTLVSAYGAQDFPRVDLSYLRECSEPAMTPLADFVRRSASTERSKGQ
jgi:hypothetical protein